MVVHVIDGFNLSVDRGPNWLFVKLRPKRRFQARLSRVADQLWSIATRHFIYRVVLELEELNTLPANMIEQLVLLQERLVQCDGALRICGLSPGCSEKLREQEPDVALPSYATRQAAVLGEDVTALRDRLREVLSTYAMDGECDAALARREPCLQ